MKALLVLAKVTVLVASLLSALGGGLWYTGRLGGAAWHSGAAPQGSQVCPCAQAKKRCVEADGAVALDGECKELWRSCKARMNEKMMAAFGPDAKTESGGQHPCRAAKLECSTPSGEKELEGDCLRKWNLCGHALGFPWMRKDGTPARSSGSCPCGQAKKRCLAADGAHLLDGECADLWSKCDELKERAARKRRERAQACRHTCVDHVNFVMDAANSQAEANNLCYAMLRVAKEFPNECGCMAVKTPALELSQAGHPACGSSTQSCPAVQCAGFNQSWGCVGGCGGNVACGAETKPREIHWTSGPYADPAEDPGFDTWSREQYDFSIDTEVRHMSAQQP